MTDVQTIANQIVENVERVIVGKRQSVQITVLGLLCQGHILIEDVPGVGKTVLAKSLSKSVGCQFQRIQFFNAFIRQFRNIIIDGNSSAFDDDNNSDLTLENEQNFVAAGFSVSFKTWSLLFSIVDASKDVEENDDDRYSFGSLSVSWIVD